MNRRNFMASAGVLASSVVASNLMAKDEHADHKNMKVKKRVLTKAEKNLLVTTQDCEATGKLCTAHCFGLIAAGNFQMVECQQTVLNMISVVQAVHTNVSYGSAKKEDLIALTKACRAFCVSCKEQCDKHVDHHAECKACAESCEKCIKACDEYIKA